ncbi:MAG: hypothetical protein EBV30_11040 [Actinobacteria bacterium]|nr:hypothetical protein [Actinomycetota bacterium]
MAMTIIAAHSQRTSKDVESTLMKRVTQAELAAHLPEILEEVKSSNEPLEVLLESGETFILLQSDEWSKAQDELEILSDEETLSAIKQGREDIAAGRFYSSEDEAFGSGAAQARKARAHEGS